MMRAFTIILLLSLTTTSKVFCQEKVLTLAKHQIFFQKLNAFQFVDAKQILESKDSSIVEYHFLSAYYYWWQYLTTPFDKTLRVQFLFHLNASLSSVQNTNKNALTQYIELTTYAFYARVSIHEDKYLDAIQYVNKITSIIEYSMHRVDESPYYKLTSGLYNFAAGYGKRNYWYLYPYFLLIPAGDEEKGIVELKSLTDCEDYLLQNEANYFLMKIYMDGYNDFNYALKYSLSIANSNPTNLIYQGLLYKIYCEIGLITEVEKQKIVYLERLEEIRKELSLAQYNFLKNIENIQ